MPAETARQSNHPLISVIIPTYNPGDKLRLSLDSLAAQPYSLWDAIVRDASPDYAPCETIVAEFVKAHPEARVTYIGGPDKGVYDAFNKGIERTDGCYLYFLGAGDLVLDGVFQTLAPDLQAHFDSGETCVFYGNWTRPNLEQPLGNVFTWVDFARKRNICHQAIFYSRSIFSKYGLYDLRYKPRADNVLNIKLWGLSAVKKIYVPMSIACYEWDGGSETTKDPAFQQDHTKLMTLSFGPAAWILCQLLALKRIVTGQKEPI
jgi:glycosyltransferase involved in cell wall biosynthesis